MEVSVLDIKGQETGRKVALNVEVQITMEIFKNLLV